MTEKAYLKLLRNHFAAHADQQRAVAMSAYMKEVAPFFGIPSPLRRQLTREFYATHGLPEPDAVSSLVRLLWEQPERECHYFAMELCGKFARKATPDAPALYEHLILHHSWWDTVDYIAPHLFGPWLKRHPEQTTPLVNQWLKSGQLWLWRTALLFQLNYKTDTDEQLLFRICRQLAPEKEFFVRKGIGWALRHYARVAPKQVQEFVAATPDLSPLSRKEALKHF